MPPALNIINREKSMGHVEQPVSAYKLLPQHRHRIARQHRHVKRRPLPSLFRRKQTLPLHRLGRRGIQYRIVYMMQRGVKQRCHACWRRLLQQRVIYRILPSLGAALTKEEIQDGARQ